MLARKRRQHAIAVAVFAGRPAHRAGKRDAAAEPRDGDRRIRRTTAVDDEKVGRHLLAVGLRKSVDAKNLVEHDDPGAQNARRHPAAAECRTQDFSLPGPGGHSRQKRG